MATNTQRIAALEAWRLTVDPRLAALEAKDTTLVAADAALDTRLDALEAPEPPPPPSPVSGRGPRPAPPVPTGANVHTIPSSIASNGTGDVGAAITAWLNTLPAGSIAKFTTVDTEGYEHDDLYPPAAVYRMSTAIDVPKPDLTLWGYGVRLLPVGPPSAHSASAIRYWRDGKCTIRGFDILGANAAGGTANALSMTGQFAMGVNIAANNSVDVLDCWIRRTWGDGIFLAGWGDTDYAPYGYEWAYNRIELVGRMGMTCNQNDSNTAWIHHNYVGDTGMYNIDGEDQRLGTDKLVNVLVEENDFGTFSWWNGGATGYLPRSVSWLYDYWTPLPNMAEVGPVTIRNNSFAGCADPFFQVQQAATAIIDQRDVFHLSATPGQDGDYHDFTVTGNDFSNVPANQRSIAYWCRIHRTRNVTIRDNTGLGAMAGRVTTTGSTGVSIGGNT